MMAYNIQTHIKCRNSLYPFSKITRLFVPDNKVSWNVPWADYNPPEYNSEVLQNKPWADNDIGENWKFNALDGNVNRKSYVRNYEIKNSYPLNPIGRTGLRGRGVLGRWGPNHAADPIVTRWKRLNGDKQLHSKTNMPILQVCVIQRRDNNEWALPGGMVDPGEHVSQTLKREFMEEAMNSLESDPEQKSLAESMISKFFASGVEIHAGYVDDPRNTDNAWMETIAMNFHDDLGTTIGKFQLQAGDDAKNVKWLDLDKDVKLYASHEAMVQKVVRLRGAHWF